jgi:hypothetical protein
MLRRVSISASATLLLRGAVSVAAVPRWSRASSTTTAATGNAETSHRPADAATPDSNAAAGASPSVAGGDSAPDVAAAAKAALARRKAAQEAAAKTGAAGAVVPAKKQIKYKVKAPWGGMQLRDTWSEDAMSRYDKDNFSGRIDSEHRYHPEAHIRVWLRYMAYSFIPLIIITFNVCYYVVAGQPLWKGDFQHILNLFRTFDTSPRSKMSVKRMDPPETIV